MVVPLEDGSSPQLAAESFHRNRYYRTLRQYHLFYANFHHFFTGKIFQNAVKLFALAKNYV
jgi:hypothetical protein